MRLTLDKVIKTGVSISLFLALFLFRPCIVAALDKVTREVLDYIRENYVDAVDMTELEDAGEREGVKAVIKKLDSFSQFLEHEQQQEMQTATVGQFGGLGIRIEIRNGHLTVMTPIPDTPAYRAGILPGDQVVKIDGQSTEGLTLQEAVKKLRGAPETKITITVVHKESTEPTDITLKREIIKIESVRARMLDQKIAYLQIIEFTAKAVVDSSKALENLQSEGMEALILDLRNNPGGLLNVAVNIAKLFLGENKLIVYTEGRKFPRVDYHADPKAPYNEIPMAVLVNEGSAAGSEILAGALQEYHRALILGMTTFGKASVQSVIPLSDGSGLRLTTAKYYTPTGRLIQKNEETDEGGIIPDITIEVLAEEEIKLRKYQQEREVYGKNKPVVKSDVQVQDTILNSAINVLHKQLSGVSIANIFKERQGMSGKVADLWQTVQNLNEKYAKEMQQELGQIKSKPEKGEFETTEEYQKKLNTLETKKKSIEQEYLQKVEKEKAPLLRQLDVLLKQESKGYGKVNLGAYNADRGSFPVEIKYAGKKWDFTVIIPRTEAPRIKSDGLISEIYYRHKVGNQAPIKEIVRIILKDSNLGEIYRWSSEETSTRSEKVSKPAIPPRLMSPSVTFKDENGNNILEAQEKGQIVVEISNKGKGSAYGVSINLDPTTISNLSYQSHNFVGEISPEQSKIVEVPIKAELDVASQQNSLTINISESNGFDAGPVKLTFQSKAFEPPKLVIADFGMKDANGNGKVEVGELVEVTLRIQNTGYGKAEELKLSLMQTDANTFIQGDSKIVIEEMGSGQSKDIPFTIFTNMRFSQEKMKFNAELSEKHGKFGGSFPIEIVVNKPIRTISEVVVKGQEEQRQEISLAKGLSVDVDENIPIVSSPKPDALTVIFGIEHYKKVSGVTFARRDASIFRDYTVKVFGVPDSKNNIFFLTEDVTLGEFKKAFGANGWLARRVKPSSEVYIFYAGHGAPDIENKRGYLIPQDGDPNYAAETGYSIDELYKFLGNLNVKSVTVFLDSCFSGANRENQMLLAQARPLVTRVKIDVEGMNSKLSVFSAASGDQISSGYQEKMHGLFSYFLMKGLRGDADSNKDGSLMTEELERYLKKNVQETAVTLDREQVPELMGDRSQVLVRYEKR